MSKKISELDQVNNLYEGCCFPLVQNDETKKVTYNILKNQILEDSNDIIEVKIDRKVNQKVDEDIQKIIKEEVVETLDNKVDKVSGKGLSTNDFTTTEKNKLAGLNNYDDTEVKSEIANKVDKVSGKGLSTNDFTSTYKTKLDGVETGANKTSIINNLTSDSAANALSANQGKVLNETKLEVDNIKAGNNITLSVDGKNVTINSTGGGSSTTVEDNLTSTSTTNALSAKQGKVLNDKITNLATYSTNEIKTGEAWIDGKPIYRKVIEVTSTSGNSTEVDLSSLNISTIFFDLSKSYYKWNDHTRIFPVISVNVEATTASSSDVAKNQCGVYYNYSSKKMMCEFGNSRKIYNGVVTIEYTKTTD